MVSGMSANPRTGDTTATVVQALQRVDRNALEPVMINTLHP